MRCVFFIGVAQSIWDVAFVGLGLSCFGLQGVPAVRFMSSIADVKRVQTLRLLSEAQSMTPRRPKRYKTGFDEITEIRRLEMCVHVKPGPKMCLTPTS